MPYNLGVFNLSPFYFMADGAKVLPADLVSYSEEEQAKLNKGRIALAAWVTRGQVTNFEDIPQWMKFTLLQKTPDQFVRFKPLTGKVKCPYVSHGYVEKALNFIFNFKISTEKVGETVFEVTEKKTQNGIKKIYEAKVTIKFTFGTGENQIVRTVIGTHKAYENDAVSKFDTEKSAYSKAWTVVARTFGIGADLEGREEKAYKAAEKDEDNVQVKVKEQAPAAPAPAATQKSFDPKAKPAAPAPAPAPVVPKTEAEVDKAFEGMPNGKSSGATAEVIEPKPAPAAQTSIDEATGWQATEAPLPSEPSF